MSVSALLVLSFTANPVKANLIQTSDLNSDLVNRTNTTLSKDFVLKNHVNSDGDMSHNKDILDKLTGIAATTIKNFSQNGVASWYGRQLKFKQTKQGDQFDQNDLTASHKSLPIDCLIRVTNQENGKSIVVKVKERQVTSSNRIVDLSYSAAKFLGVVEKGTVNVRIEKVSY